MARIVGVDLPKNKRGEIGLTYICLLYTSLDIYSSTPKTIDALMKLELPSGVEVEIKV